MHSSLTPTERRLAAVIPCTAAGAVAWYSRWWRLPNRRLDAVMQAGIILIAVLLIVWISLLPKSGSQPQAMTAGVRWALVVAALFFGGAAGALSASRVSLRIQTHWLAWCLRDGQRRNEVNLQGVWGGLRGALGVACLCAFASHWLAISAFDMAAAVSAFVTAFVFAFLAMGRGTRASAPSANNRTWARRIPAAVLLQASRPGWVLGCAAVAMLLVAFISVWAAHIENANLLGIAVAVAFVGFALCQSLLVAGATSLHALLEWTSASPWRMASRLIWFPAAVAGGLAAPIAIAGAFLKQPMWSVIALLGPVMAGYGAVVWVVSDLVRLRGGRGPSFRIVNIVLPLATLGTGPFAAVVLPLHFGWLIRRGHRAWRGIP